MSLCSELCHRYSQGEKYLDLGHAHWCAPEQNMYHTYHTSSKLKFVNQLSLHNYSHSPFFFSDITNENIVVNVPPLVDFINLNTKSLN